MIRFVGCWLVALSTSVSWGQTSQATNDIRLATAPTPEKALFEMTPLDQISLDPRPLYHPAPKLTNTPWVTGRIGDLRELRMEQGWSGHNMQWRATNFAHRPLYFEDILLERHGQTRGCLQPFYSAMHFFGSLPILPYKMGLERPWDCVYTLGYGRPGNCKRPLKNRLVVEPDAAALESGAWIAAVLLLP